MYSFPIPTFDAVYTRMRFVSGAETLVDLADAVDARASDVSAAARKGEAPFAWLFTLMDKYNASPMWLLTGEGKPHVTPDLPPEERKALFREITTCLEAFVQQDQQASCSEEERKLRALRNQKVHVTPSSQSRVD